MKGNEPSVSGASVDPVIRNYQAQDESAVSELDRHARSRLRAAKGGVAWLAEHPPIDELLLRGGSQVLVALLCGDIIGYLVTSDAVVPGLGRICSIERVFVHEAARGIGGGDALLQEALTRARRRSCDVIEADALPGDRDTKNLFERAGITARRITVSKRLSDLSIEGPASR